MDAGWLDSSNTIIFPVRVGIGYNQECNYRVKDEAYHRWAIITFSATIYRANFSTSSMAFGAVVRFS